MYKFFLGGSLFFWQNTSGINAINYYSPTVFKSMGINGTNTGLFTTGLFGVVKTAFTFLYLLFLIETVGRCKLLMIGALGGGLCLWYVGAYIAIAKPSPSLDAKLTPAGTSAVFFFYLWTVSHLPPFLSFTLETHNNCTTGLLLPNLEPHTLGLQQRNVRQQPPRPRTSIRRSKQLVLEFHRRTLHASNVYFYGLRCLLLLRIPNDVFIRLRLLLDA